MGAKTIKNVESKKIDQSVVRLLSGHGKAIPLFKVFMPESIIEPLKDVLLSGYIGEGPKVKEFEKELGMRFQNENVLTVNNGTSAIQISLRLANVGLGDEVITTPMTCVATNVPILALGAKIVWADIDPWTGNIDPNDVARKVTSKTKAIVCVHWGGYPCELNELNSIASEHGIKLIEDACHAFGATYQDKPIGSVSDFACFSFQAIKHMTTVDGGALACKQAEDCHRGKLLRWYGINHNTMSTDMRCEADIPEFGYKFHMNDVAAIMGIEQLKYVDKTLEKHRANAASYNQAFAGLSYAHPLHYKTDRNSAYWLYTIRVKDRLKFVDHLKKAGITSSQVHARNDIHTIFNDSRVALPGVEEYVSQQVSIPVGWWLTDTELKHIIKTVKEYNRLEQ